MWSRSPRVRLVVTSLRPGCPQATVPRRSPGRAYRTTTDSRYEMNRCSPGDCPGSSRRKPVGEPDPAHHTHRRMRDQGSTMVEPGLAHTQDRGPWHGGCEVLGGRIQRRGAQVGESGFDDGSFASGWSAAGPSDRDSGGIQRRLHQQLREGVAGAERCCQRSPTGARRGRGPGHGRRRRGRQGWWWSSVWWLRGRGRAIAAPAKNRVTTNTPPSAFLRHLPGRHPTQDWMVRRAPHRRSAAKTGQPLTGWALITFSHRSPGCQPASRLCLGGDCERRSLSQSGPPSGPLVVPRLAFQG